MDTDKESITEVLHSSWGSSAIFEATTLVDLLQSMESGCALSGPASILPQLGAFEAAATAYHDGLLCLTEELRKAA